MGNDELISRREADQRIERITDDIREIKEMLKEALEKSGAHATQIALLNQRIDGHDRWRYVWGAGLIAAFIEFVTRKLGH